MRVYESRRLQLLNLVVECVKAGIITPDQIAHTLEEHAMDKTCTCQHGEEIPVRYPTLKVLGPWECIKCGLPLHPKELRPVRIVGRRVVALPQGDGDGRSMQESGQ